VIAELVDVFAHGILTLTMVLAHRKFLESQDECKCDGARRTGK